MEITAEREAEERRREHWKLLSSLKTTVEGLVSSNNPNVWSRYGGLQRLHKDMNSILSHGLKHEQVYYKQKDYWPFVWCVRYISPHLASHVEQFSKLEPVLSSGMRSAGESHKAERWLLHSLQVHLLSAQLRPLLRHQGHTRKYFNEEAFLLSEPHVTAMFQCLEAVEQNNPRLLALIDTARLSPLKGLMKTQSMCVLVGAGRTSNGPQHGELSRRFTASQLSLREGPSATSTPTSTTASLQNTVNTDSSAPGAPWLCVSGTGECERGATPPPVAPAVPRIALTEPASPPPDAGEADYDDGPEYLAIGNLGQRRPRRDSRCSAAASEPEEVLATPLGQSSLAGAPPPLRRSSFSVGQKGPDRGGRGHVRSVSDTGLGRNHRHESPEVDSCVQGYGPFSPPSSDASTASSLYMESNGSQYGSVPDGMFRKPSEGQSLISYLSEQDFGSCADLEKENAHFSISESLIAAIELMKCNLRRRQEEGGGGGEEEGDSDSEIQLLKQKIRLRRQQLRHGPTSTCTPSQHLFHSTDSGGSRRSSQDSLHTSDSDSVEEVVECELKDADIKRSVTSSGRSFLSSESISPSFLQSNSAESVAMGLLRQFEGMQLPAASELDWLVPEHDAPQKLLPIPDSLPISPDDGEHADIYKLRIRVRGNLEWAPPRPQIIFNIHPAPKRKIIVAKQNYRCAGCGIRIDPDYIKRLRYCEYLGRYFCQCCHENAQTVVPGRVLRKWDFSKYYVSNFARDLLGKIAGDPLFNPNDINNSLYKKNKALETVRVLRVQLFHMKNLFKTCRLAKDVLDQFDSLPGHLTEDLHLFSLNDLGSVRSGELAPRLRDLLKLGSAHVASCVLCQAKGFVCEFCNNDKDIIFPFELHKCQRCEGEPPLVAGGICGLRPSSSSPAPSWRNWKFPRPRRLARALSQDRREGEGGELDESSSGDQGTGSGVEEAGGEPGEGREGGAEEKEAEGAGEKKKGERETLFGAFRRGRLAAAFSRGRGTEGGTEGKAGARAAEREGAEGEDREMSGGVRKEASSLFEVLNISKTTKKLSTAQGADRLAGVKGDKEQGEKEQIDEDGGEEKEKGEGSVPRVGTPAKALSGGDLEDRGKRGTDAEGGGRESEEESSKQHRETESDEEEVDREDSVTTAKEGNQGKESSLRERRGEVGGGKTGRFLNLKMLKPSRLANIFSRDTRESSERDASGESDGADDRHAKETEAPFNWRSRKTRRARRITKVRKEKKGGEESQECKACFHRNCFKGVKECPRCQRLAERRERMARKNMEEQEDKEEDEGGGS
ncbi:run domain Beclin-1-interacting and cysteine-rich domain-containing protein isoform X3 [Hypomesus transpacificus]|uniref:run domain Beclin-1-interacting and cysteine-rich domain-containing protein isoform X3 n=1 Tax=Hypomesus transpacificus TaxID=137520 RepID=UPI001F07CDD4|nr:run domain Beclin-1-interacting and cysteine-rich domain-containing protein isoform X3 [Hypomesus transpacificus]